MFKDTKKRNVAVSDVIKIGVICPSEIAFRRFLPALTQNELVNKTFRFAGVAVASPEEWFGNLSDVPQEQIESQQTKELEKARLPSEWSAPEAASPTARGAVSKARFVRGVKS